MGTGNRPPPPPPPPPLMLTRTLAGELPVAALSLPWAPGSSAGRPSVSWGWVSPQQTKWFQCICVCGGVGKALPDCPPLLFPQVTQELEQCPSPPGTGLQGGARL